MSTKHPFTKEYMSIWQDLISTYNLCSAILNDSLAGISLRLVEHEILIYLLFTPGLTQQELAKRCFIAKSGMSVLINQMETTGILVRIADLGDKRIWRLSLTKHGEALATECLEIQNNLIARMYESFTLVEIKSMIDMQKRIVDKLKDMQKPVGQRDEE